LLLSPAVPHPRDAAAADTPVPLPHGDAAFQFLFELTAYVMEGRASFATVALEFPEKARSMTRGGAGDDGLEPGMRRWQLTTAGEAGGAWTLAKSVWRARVVESDSRAFYDTPALLGRAFEADFANCKIARVVKDDVQRALLKPVLKARYPIIREMFRYYCCSGSGSANQDPFSISFNQFTELRRDCMIESAGHGAELDMVFVASNVELVESENNPDHALMRHELLEAVVRLAFVMFPPDWGRKDGPAQSLDRLLDKLVVPTMTAILNVPDPREAWSNVFRRERMYKRPVDVAMRTYLPTLQAIFARYARAPSSGPGGGMQFKAPPTSALVSPRAGAAGAGAGAGGGARVPLTTRGPGGVPDLVSSAMSLDEVDPSLMADRGREGRRAVKKFLFLDAWIALLDGANVLHSGILEASDKATGSARGAGTVGGTGGAGGAGTGAGDGVVATEKAIFTDRDAKAIFLFSNLTCVDELHRSAAASRRCIPQALTFMGFLEAVCRFADSNGCPSAADLAAAAAAAKAAEAKARGRAGGDRRLRRGRDSRGDDAPADDDDDRASSGSDGDAARAGGRDSAGLDGASPTSSPDAPTLATEAPPELEARLPLTIAALASGAGVPLMTAGGDGGAKGAHHVAGVVASILQWA
jgi:hypothetical protein